MKSNILGFIVLILFFNTAVSQESYVVNTESLNMRESPNTSSNVLYQLKRGDVVTKISVKGEWWIISRYGNKGYVMGKYLVNLDKSEEFQNWQKLDLNSGESPDCENITPQYDKSIDNKLRIKVGVGNDVVVKLMTLDEKCYRIVYVKAGDTYNITNIPENKYYLRIAYGREFRKYTENEQCIVKFLNDPQYEKGTDILDFYKKKGEDMIVGDKIYSNWRVPSYELLLKVVNTEFNLNNFKTNQISEKAFNQ